MRTTTKISVLLLLSSLPWLPAARDLAASASRADDVLRGATAVFSRITDAAPAALPASILARARGIAVFPAAREDGGKYYALGAMSGRGADPAYWTPPAIVVFQGAIPFALDVESVDFVVVALTPRGARYLANDLAQEVGTRIYPGPLGWDAQERLEADLLGYVQFGDFFAGVSIDQWSVGSMPELNRELYGSPYSSGEITRGTGLRLPPAARAWRDAVLAGFRQAS